MNTKKDFSVAQSLAWTKELDAYLDTPEGLAELERMDQSMRLDDYAEPIITH